MQAGKIPPASVDYSYSMHAEHLPSHTDYLQGWGERMNDRREKAAAYSLRVVNFS